MTDTKAAKVVVACTLAQLVVGPITLRDLRRRDAAQVRGPKLLWRLWAGSNLFGAATYWAVGRR
ncbi:hypothetical protein AB3X52_05390 [Nocardioides sp. DS6]|uniref:Cardiolipin synthase N-terminal domain-containing protein n=1 Tax=Nocardioides eburneus TaxID=3231482 RepID=A0ABV3SVT3_9ACTN